MTPKYDVRWTTTAEKDLEGIIEFIVADSVGDARAVLARIRKRTSALHNFPERCRIVPELKEQGVILYRELIVKPWRIMYRIIGKQVFALAVLDSRRDLEDLLLERFTGKI